MPLQESTTQCPCTTLETMLIFRAGPLLLSLTAPPALCTPTPPLTTRSSSAMTTQNNQPDVYNWDFLDAAYLITCPQPDGTNPRLQETWPLLQSVGLDKLVNVRKFEKDDDDRIRGCYNSHIQIMKEAQNTLKGRENINVLVLEDNLALSTRFQIKTLDAVREFVTGSPAPGDRRDMAHLAYIMYVPGLSVERTDDEHIVRLICTPDSVLGTSAYILTRSGLDSVLHEHERVGYVDAIPNVMARLFADSRFAAFPMLFHRSAGIKSLVNAQLDTLRALIFIPAVFTKWEWLLVSTGLSTNVLFPALCLLVAVGAVSGASELVYSLSASARGEQVGVLLPLLSAISTTGFLAILAYGLALAPKPQPAMEDSD